MTVYYLALSAECCRPMGSFTFSAPCVHWPRHRRANRPLSDPLCIHISNVASTITTPAHDVSTCSAWRPCRTPKRLCGPPTLHPRRLETDGFVIVSGSASLF